MQGNKNLYWALFWLAMLLGTPARALAGDRCDVCDGEFGPTIYLFTDKVTGETKRTCYPCSMLPTVCYLCGVPVKNGYQTLSDGRVICARDAKTVVIDGTEGKQISIDIGDKLNRSFSRFITFPTANVTFGVVDRLNIQELFKIAGNDYSCPDVWGYYRPETNGDASISHLTFILTGLPRSAFRVTFAHELTHAWEHDNISGTRRKQLSADSYEAFCELVAYKLADEEHDENAKRQILLNQYTRGQIDVFIATDQRYGFNDIVDWMKYGTVDRLDAADLDLVHKVNMPDSPSHPASIFTSYIPVSRTPTRDRLMLEGILWSKSYPTATVNGHTFSVNETAEVRVGTNTVMVHCVSILKDEVRLQAGAGEIQVLKFKGK